LDVTYGFLFCRIIARLPDIRPPKTLEMFVTLEYIGRIINLFIHNVVMRVHNTEKDRLS